MEIAQDVKKVVEEKTDYKKLISLKVTHSDDKRSYHINSDKIKNKLGFVPKEVLQMQLMDYLMHFRIICCQIV